MNKGLVLYQGSLPSPFVQTERYELEHHTVRKPSHEAKPEVLFISSYPPRACGLATYTFDLIKSIEEQYRTTFKISMCALQAEPDQFHYARQPKYVLNVSVKNSFRKTAFLINKDESIKLVVVQHEFGLFYSADQTFLSFLELINKPVIIIFHTVLPNPDAQLMLNVQHIAGCVSEIVVMTHLSKSILIKDYQIAETNISVIEHGTHLIAPKDKDKLKQKYQLPSSKVLMTFGLVNSNKGFETTIDALPEVVARFPDVVFLIVGKTHPNIVAQEGEVYREMLEAKVALLGLENNVRFVNEYVELPVLLDYLQLTDVYLFTSVDPNQAVSGTFAYAVSCGCPIISTPIPHVKEFADRISVSVVDFRSSEQLSKAIIDLLENDELRERISVNNLIKMAPSAWQNVAMSYSRVFEKASPAVFNFSYKLPPISLTHLLRLTTSYGIIQFSKIASPDLTTGYTLDDNARALIVACQHYEITSNTDDLALINTYLMFIKDCMISNGLLFNYVTYQRQFSFQNVSENLEDSTGRAVWAIGYLLSIKELLPRSVVSVANELFESLYHHLDQVHSTRAMAFIIKGLCYQDNQKYKNKITLFADRLTQMYRHEADENWKWFEDSLTYGNSLLPEAMLCAYVATDNPVYKKIALDSFDFLISKIFSDTRIKVITNKGWLKKNKGTNGTIGGEQPIDVAYTIMAMEKFYEVFDNRKYLIKAGVAFEWFLGNNHLGNMVYNPCTGGCYDGIEADAMNLNQGAESTLGYLLARLSLERLRLADNDFVFKDKNPIRGVERKEVKDLMMS
jgi:glycosyltransferase involved in cell wall biosynthesis